MIDLIIKEFRELARKHKLIKSFYYDKNYEIGEGNEIHPLFWLEEPIYGTNDGANGQGFYNTVTFSILLIPDTDRDVKRCQELAFSCGLNIIEKIKRNEDDFFTVKPDWNYLTLSDYYDNNSAGCRFTVNLYCRNITDLCLLDEQFDNCGSFVCPEPMNDFKVKPESPCETFTNKVLDFDIPTKRKRK